MGFREMTENKREIIGAVSVAVTAELIVVLVIFIAAAIGVNIGRITEAVANWGAW